MANLNDDVLDALRSAADDNIEIEPYTEFKVLDAEAFLNDLQAAGWDVVRKEQ